MGVNGYGKYHELLLSFQQLCGKDFDATVPLFKVFNSFACHI
jgi:hypothetical protein